MAEKRIDELVSANQVLPEDLFVLEQENVAKKLTGQTLETWLLSFAEGHGGIASIEKTSTEGLEDTYTITFSDASTYDYVVKNGEKGDKGDPASTEDLNAWLEDNISQETGYVLDRSLSSAEAAAPADLVGDLKSAMNANLMELSDTQKLSVQYTLDDGGINSSGTEIDGANYMRTRDYYSTADNSSILKFLVESTSSYACYVCYYNSSKVFDSRVAVDTTTVLDTTKDLFRLSFYRDGGRNETLFRSWISWVYSDETDKRFVAIEKELNGYVSSGIQFAGFAGYLIEMGNARYEFRRVTDNAINLDTWRLYKGSIKNGTKELIMWENSDAEGVIRLINEDDYIGGFHGDENYQSIDLFIDGVKANTSNAFARKNFKTISIFVTSKVYHAGTNTQAFSRSKMLTFEAGKVTIGNCWTAVGAQTIQQAPLMLFQCNKNNTNSELVFTNYEVDADYKIYSTTDASTYPPTTDYAKSARFITGYGEIEVTVEQIDNAYASDYRCVVSASFLTSQDRLKVYFNTIRDKSAGTAIADGASLVSRFSFSVK